MIDYRVFQFLHAQPAIWSYLAVKDDGMSAPDDSLIVGMTT